MRTWQGTPPERCDLCRTHLQRTFFDARLASGQWGNICPDCFHTWGVGLGTGKGQRYELQDGQWVNTTPQPAAPRDATLVKVACNECACIFTARINESTVEVECESCGSTDVEPV